MKAKRGNILFIILLAVILFAALAYAVTQSLRGGGKDASSETASAKAAVIVQWLDMVDLGITRMRMTKNISAENISFEYIETTYGGTVNPVYTANANCTSDNCRLFKTDGGGVPAVQFQDAAMADPIGWLPAYPAPGFYDFWVVQWPYAGTAANDIAIRVMALDPAVCNQINANLGITVSIIPGGPSLGIANPALWDNPGQTFTNPGALQGKNTFAQLTGGTCLLWHLLIAR